MTTLNSARALAAALLIAGLAPAAAIAKVPVDVKIVGMTCKSCLKSVRDELAKIPGVDGSTLSVELNGNHATMVVAKNDEATIVAIRDAVKKAGFVVDQIDFNAGTEKPKAKN